MKFARIFLKGNDNPLRWVDVPTEGTFAGFCHAVTVNGCVLPGQVAVWIPVGEIKFMFEIEANAPSMFFGPVEGKPN